MQKPAVWKPFLFYVCSLIVIYALLVLMGFGMVYWGATSSDAEAGQLLFTGVLLIGFTIPFMVALGAGPFLPRKKWAWVYNLILIALGMGSCWMPLCLYLMIKWVEPEVKDYYGA